MPLAIRQWRRNRRLRLHLAALAAAICVFSYLGPFGTGTRLGAAELVVYWAVAMGVNWLVAVAVISWAVNALRRSNRAEWPGVVGGAAVAAIPGTGVVFALESLLGSALGTAGGLLYLYSCVALVMLVVGYFVHRLVEAPLRESAGEPPGPAPFLERLPRRLGRQLLHLHMRDHYVEAFTPLGSDLILLRFGDALREVAGLDGLQVHRSHWVAAAAVEGGTRRGGRALLRLVNGAEVPVSRSFVPAVRERGWL